MTASARRWSAWPFVAAVLGLQLSWAFAVSPALSPGAADVPVVLWGRAVSRVAAYYWAWSLGATAGGLAAIAVLRRRQVLSWRSFGPILLSVVPLVVGARWHYRLETMGVWEALALPPSELLGAGMRIPLGLLLGGVVACGLAALFGSPWRAVGDAYAMSSSVMIPIGRIGCLLYGCCMGTVCLHWPDALCLAWPPGTEAYRHQLTAGFIPIGAALSLPAHPLPAYFALASILTAGVLVVLLRRGAPAGALLGAFCVLRPLAKLGLEPLRLGDRGGILMVGIPASVLIGCLAAILWGARSRSRQIADRDDRPVTDGVPVRTG